MMTYTCGSTRASPESPRNSSERSSFQRRWHELAAFERAAPPCRHDFPSPQPGIPVAVALVLC